MLGNVGVGKIDLLVHTFPNLGLQSKYTDKVPKKPQNSLFAPSKVTMHIVIICKYHQKKDHKQGDYWNGNSWSGHTS